MYSSGICFHIGISHPFSAKKRNMNYFELSFIIITTSTMKIETQCFDIQTEPLPRSLNTNHNWALMETSGLA